MRQFLSKRNKWIVFLLVLLLLALPMHFTCGHIGYACASAPDASGYYYTYYEVQPLGVTLLEVFVPFNLPIYYTSGKESHFIGVP